MVYYEEHSVKVEEIEYVDSIDDIKLSNPNIICKYCDKPLYKPVYCNICEKWICEKCAQPFNSENCCKFCNEKDYYTRRIININGHDEIIHNQLISLKIYCPYKKYGCEWSGTRNDFGYEASHISYCYNKRFAECIYGCEKMVLNNDYSHLDHCKKFKLWVDKIEDYHSDYRDNKKYFYERHRDMDIDHFEEKINEIQPCEDKYERSIPYSKQDYEKEENIDLYNKKFINHIKYLQYKVETVSKNYNTLMKELNDLKEYVFKDKKN